MKNKKTWRLYFHFLKVLKPYKYVLTFIIALGFLAILADVVTPYMSKIFFDVAIPQKRIPLVYQLAVLTIVLRMVSNSIRQISARLKIKMIHQVGLELKTMLLNRFYDLQYSFYCLRNTGDMMHLHTVDIENVRDIVVTPIPELIFATTKFILFLTICLYINWKLTFLSLATFPILLLNNQYMAKGLRLKNIDVQKTSVALTSTLQENISGIELIKMFSVEGNIKEKITLLVKKLTDLIIKREFFRMVGIYIQEIFLSLWGSFILAYTGLQIIKGTLSIGETVALGVYISQLNSPINTILGTVIKLYSGFVSLERIGEVYDYPEEEKGYKADFINGPIEFKGVSFKYPSTANYVLTDLSFLIENKTIVGLVGPNGAGKTTVAKLLCRLYEPSTGSILVNGHDIVEYDIKAYRKQISVVSQEPLLFNMTIAENILYSNEGTLEEVDYLCQLFGVNHVFERLPDGLGTVVGEKGGRISKGQKQVTAILRAVISNPRILILDEAFSYLDLQVRDNIMENIFQALPETTIICITHEDDLLNKADMIINIQHCEYEIAEV